MYKIYKTTNAYNGPCTALLACLGFSNHVSLDLYKVIFTYVFHFLSSQMSYILLHFVNKSSSKSAYLNLTTV